MSEKIFYFPTLLIFFCFTSLCTAQIEEEIPPPYHIKTISFIQNNQNVIPIFRLGDTFQLQFDDLYGNEADYYYTITLCNYDWSPAVLPKNEYLIGFDNFRIIDYENSFNTLQLYSHYRLRFPNEQTSIKISGNYILKILDSNQEVVFSRKFILHESLVTVPLQIKRSREVSTINHKQNLEFSILSPNLIFQNPLQNVKVLLMQNGEWGSTITKIKPQFTRGNDLIYRYDHETQFCGGNEFLLFDTKDVRNANNNIRFIDAKEVYNTHLFTNQARANQPYTFFPDVNGNFSVRNLNARDSNELEADYTWVYFSLNAPAYFGNKGIYVGGMFNNYARIPEYKMDYNEKKGIYEKAIMVKQGFTNYKYTLYDGKEDNENAIDGNFFQTENEYIVIVYYRANNDRYDRVIGKGVASSVNIIN